MFVLSVFGVDVNLVFSGPLLACSTILTLLLLFSEVTLSICLSLTDRANEELQSTTQSFVHTQSKMSAILGAQDQQVLLH